MGTNTGVYDENLRHYARPINDREAQAEGETLNDYEALYLAEILHEWAEYLVEQHQRADVARGYVEYIRRRQQETGGYRQVKLYAHTPLAAHTLERAVEDWGDIHEGDPSYHPSLIRRVRDATEELAAPYREEDETDGD